MTSTDPAQALRERLREVLAGKFVAPGKHYLVSEADLKEVLEALASPALGETAGKEGSEAGVAGVQGHDVPTPGCDCPICQIVAGSSRDTEGQ